MHRYGWKLVCGWLPPTGQDRRRGRAQRRWCPRCRGRRRSTGPSTLPVADVLLPMSVDASRAWVWAGICWMVSVTDSTPPVSARIEAAALVDRHPAAQVRQREGALAVAAVGRADQLEQRLVLGDGQQLALAEHPARRREVAGEHPDLAYVRLCHRSAPQFWLGKMPTSAMQKVSGEEGLHVVVRLAPAGVGRRSDPSVEVNAAGARVWLARRAGEQVAGRDGDRRLASEVAWATWSASAARRWTECAPARRPAPQGVATPRRASAPGRAGRGGRS